MKIKMTKNLMVAGIIAANSVPVFAQDSAPTLRLEEVVVTARKREESMQDVSVAVSVLSAADLLDNQIRNSADLAALVPSLTLQRGNDAGGSSFNVRGMGTQSFSLSVEQSVSTMVDGVVMGRPTSSFMQLMDIQRVEVLRGPQGTLFGKNATAGVVHLITENPSEEGEIEFMGGIEEDEEYRVGINVSGPISDNLGFRLAGMYTDTDNWMKNSYDGSKFNGREEASVRGKLRWQPIDTLEFKWSSDYADSECDPCAGSPLRSLEAFGGNDDKVNAILEEIDPVVPNEENIEININSKPTKELENWGHSLEANWDIGEFTLTSITAYREVSNLGSDANLDHRPTSVLNITQGGDTEQEQWTQELRLTSPADGRLSYVAGFFYFDQAMTKSLFRGFEFGGFPGMATTSMDVDTTNWAVFGEANYDFSDTWRLIAGLRYTEDEIDFVVQRTQDGSGTGLPSPVEPTPGGTEEDDLSGKLGLEWDFSDAGMAYLTYAEGYKGPAFDITFGTNPAELMPVAPELSTSWEIGLKSNFFDDRLRMNVAVFHTEYDDFQAQAYFDPDGDPGCPTDMPGCDPDDDPGSFLLINAGDVETEGLELDFMYLATTNLRFFGGIAFIDATIVDYPEGKCSFGQVFREECPGDGLQDLSGGEMPHSPDWKLNLTAQYNIELNTSFDVRLQATLKAQDEVLYDLSQDEKTMQDGFEILDLSVSALDKSNRWEATVYVKNALDEFHVQAIASQPDVFVPNGYTHYVPRHFERTIGAEIRYRWY